MCCFSPGPPSCYPTNESALTSQGCLWEARGVPLPCTDWGPASHRGGRRRESREGAKAGVGGSEIWGACGSGRGSANWGAEAQAGARRRGRGPGTSRERGYPWRCRPFHCSSGSWPEAKLGARGLSSTRWTPARSPPRRSAPTRPPPRPTPPLQRCPRARGRGAEVGGRQPEPAGEGPRGGGGKAGVAILAGIRTDTRLAPWAEKAALQAWAPANQLGSLEAGWRGCCIPNWPPTGLLPARKA